MHLKDFKNFTLKLFAFILPILLIVNNCIAYGLDIKIQKGEENGLLEYLPFDNTASLIANLETREINSFIKNNFSERDQNNIDTLKNGLLSYAGIDSKLSISDMYDGEFALSFLKNDNAKDDILVIIKVQNSEDQRGFLNNPLNRNAIQEIDKSENLNYLKYMFLTETNILLISSNKNLIKKSLDKYSRKNISQKESDLKKYYLKMKAKKKIFLITNNQINEKFLKAYKDENEDYLITNLSYENRTINLAFHLLNDSNSFNNDEYKLLNARKDIFDDTNNVIILDNYNNLSNFSELVNLNKLQNDLLKELNPKNQKTILVNDANNRWMIINFKDNVNELKLDNLNLKKNYSKQILSLEDKTYTVFSKNNLYYGNNKINYQLEEPIFSYESKNILIISNNISVINEYSSKEKVIKELIALNSENQLNKVFKNEEIFINYLDKDYFSEYFPIFKNLKYLSGNSLNFKLKGISTSFTKQIPEIKPIFYGQAKLEITS